MKLHFYGTGASEGFPAMFCMCEHCRKARELGGKNIRTRTCTQIDEELLIDFSVDAYCHILHGGLDMSKVKNILFTHSHTDHFLPQNIVNALPPMAAADAAPHRYHLFGNSKCEAMLREVLRGKENAEQYLCFTQVEDMQPFTVSGYTVTPIETVHDPAETCFIYCIEKDGKALLYAHDSAMFTETVWQKLSRFTFRCVVLDCTSVMQPNIFQSHMSFADNLIIKARMLESGMADRNTRFVATHFAHTFNPLQQRLEEEMAPYGFIPAYDGMELLF